MRRISLPVATTVLPTLLLALTACSGSSDDDCTTNSPPGMICADSGGTVAGVGTVEGASIEIPPGALSKNTIITVSAGDEILEAEHVSVGPSVVFEPTGTTLAAAATITLPYDASLLPADATDDDVIVRWMQTTVQDLDGTTYEVDGTAGTVTISTTSLGTFEPAVLSEGAEPRLYSFRGIAGFSMGGASAIALGMNYPDEFDIIAPQGTAVDIFHFLNYLKYSALGGFCAPGEEPTQDGSMCPVDPLPCHVAGPQELFAGSVSCGFEYGYHFERMDCGGRNAGGFDRDSMLEAFQDMTHAFGNAMSYNPAHPFLPTGVTADYYWNAERTVRKSHAERCNNPVVVEKMYDRVYNPNGTYDAITFCDGNSGEQGVFDPAGANDRPADILLAFDLNGNLVRDAGEPVVFQMSEPYEDTGADGLADEDEPGYDATTNPDPAGDNFHMLNNALGTEGNGRWEDGESYEDVGIDGVVCPGDCPLDYGEGNGQFDYNPNMHKYFDMNPTDLLSSMTAEELARLDFYIDVGYRDHMFFGPNTLGFIGVLKAMGYEAGIYQGFMELIPGATKFDFGKVPWSQLPKNILVIYGDREKTEEEARNTGDGGHVGTALQVVNRALVFLGYVGQHFPEGDYEPSEVSGNNGGVVHTYTSQVPGLEGVEKEYLVYEPPGYEPPDAQGNCAKRYPVLYSLHGIGMNPEDQMAAPLIFETEMQKGAAQKFLVVLPNGRCMANECESGQFFFNTVGWAVPGKDHETSFIEELLPEVDRLWCTKQPKVIDNPPW